MLRGLLLAKATQVTNIVIFGGLIFIIRHLHNGTWLKANQLENILKRIIALLDELPHKDFFHILRK